MTVYYEDAMEWEREMQEIKDRLTPAFNRVQELKRQIDASRGRSSSEEVGRLRDELKRELDWMERNGWPRGRELYVLWAPFVGTRLPRRNPAPRTLRMAAPTGGTMNSTSFRSVPQRNDPTVTNHYFNGPGDGAAHGHVKEQRHPDGTVTYPYARDVEGREYDVG